MKLAVIALAMLAALAACTHTRHVTPWLTLSVHEPFELLADSGDPKPTYETRRRFPSGWQVVARATTALRISDDRAIYGTDTYGGYVLATAGGTTSALPPCDWILLARPDREILCVAAALELGSARHAWQPSEGVPLVVERLRYDGSLIGVAHVRLPAGAIRRDAEAMVLGLVGDALLFAVVEHDRLGGDCTLWLVRGERAVLADRLQRTEYHRCFAPASWHAKLPGPIGGELLLDERGQRAENVAELTTSE